MSQTQGKEELIGRRHYEMTHEYFCPQERRVEPAFRGKKFFIFSIRNFPYDCPTIGQLIDITKGNGMAVPNLGDVVIAFNYTDPYQEGPKVICLASSANSLPLDMNVFTTLGEGINAAMQGVRPWVWHARRVLRFDEEQKKTMLSIP